MRAHQVCILLVALGCAAESKQLIFENNLDYTIWVGSLGNPGYPHMENGGWQMDAGQQKTIDVTDDYRGRFWGRTGCNFDADGNGPCETGDCGNRLQCAGNGGNPPATLAEFTFNGDNDQDTYDVSLVDGYNLPVTMVPTDNIGGGDEYWCTAATCPSNAINAECPQELQVFAGDNVVACKSGCFANDDDESCCRGAFNDPNVCIGGPAGTNYPQFYKDRCPLAYSFAYNDQKSTFRCPKNTGYRITFG